MENLWKRWENIWKWMGNIASVIMSNGFSTVRYESHGPEIWMIYDDLPIKIMMVHRFSSTHRIVPVNNQEC